MAFYTEHIHIDGSLNVDGSIFQNNTLFSGGPGGGGNVSNTGTPLSVKYIDLLIKEVAYLKNKVKELETKLENGSTR